MSGKEEHSSVDDWTEEFERDAADPSAWSRSADKMFASADLLWREIDAAFKNYNEATKDNPSSLEEMSAESLEQLTTSVNVLDRHSFPYLLLCGYGFENLLKAIRVKQMIASGESLCAFHAS